MGGGWQQIGALPLQHRLDKQADGRCQQDKEPSVRRGCPPFLHSDSRRTARRECCPAAQALLGPLTPGSAAPRPPAGLGHGHWSAAHGTWFAVDASVRPEVRGLMEFVLSAPSLPLSFSVSMPLLPSRLTLRPLSLSLLALTQPVACRAVSGLRPQQVGMCPRACVQGQAVIKEAAERGSSSLDLCWAGPPGPWDLPPSALAAGPNQDEEAAAGLSLARGPVIAQPPRR